MSINIKTQYSFIPWLRRGLSLQISEAEKDTLGHDNKEGSAKKRANLLVKSTFDLVPANTNESFVQRSETISVALTGPGDITGIQPASILQVVPANGVTNFESNYFPFIEFFEEDIPWRYTPAKESGDKLRPWLAILVCKKEEFAITSDSEGNSYITLKIKNNEEYQKIFQSPSEIWKNAHVQFSGMQIAQNNLKSEVNQLIDHDNDVAFSRLLSSRKLEENTAYTAFLIPTFETGRLSGLGLAFDEIPAQRSAWAETFDQHKATRERPLDFPVYHHWEFETSKEDFIALAKKLKPTDANALPAALKVDVSKMGNGLNYNLFQNNQKMRSVIDIPVATHPIGYTSIPFPSLPSEQIIAMIMKDLLEKNPVLIENRTQINVPSGSHSVIKPNSFKKLINTKLDIRKIIAKEKSIDKLFYETIQKPPKLPFAVDKKIETAIQKEDTEMDDPWIVPPLYGGKHIMATSLAEEDHKNQQWFTQLNLDIRHRAAAGLGKKVVQKYQEEFVHRAWEQVEDINELNQKWRESLLKFKLDSSIYHLRFNSNRFKDLMVHLQSMKYAPLSEQENSLDKELEQIGIPSAYVSSAFQRMASNPQLPTSVNATTLSEKLLNDNKIQWKEHRVEGLITSGGVKKILVHSESYIDYLTLIKNL